ncbi:MAG: GNAT family N-acetyltransferase [Chlamydiales bacterium]|nr:GNAT family N-acetyltransferase [Chlamydiales bacterium]
MTIVAIAKSNAHIFDILAQDYEAEFSALTNKEPDFSGFFSLEASWQEPYKGFYLMLKEKPAGFVIVSEVKGRWDIAEFYILPCYRKRGLGRFLATHIFDLFPGPWQVRQIWGAEVAATFWRDVINVYTSGQFTEDRISDPHWGIVTRQLFKS